MKQLLALLLFVPSLCFAQLPDYVAVEDLIAWYPFNGNADDSGPGGHDGTLHNISFTSDRYGELNGALEFNGTSSYVSVAHDANLNLSGSEFTLSVWVNHHEFDEWDQNLVVKSDGPGSAPSKWLFWHRANVNTPSGLGFASNQMMLGGLEQVSTGGWHHYLVAKHSDRIEFYLDGQLEFTEIVEFQNDPTTAELRIGGEEPGGGNQWFDGAMDDVGIWGRALTEAEIQSLYLSSTPPTASLPIYAPSDGLLRWYSFDSNFTDFGPFGLNGTSDATFVSDRNGTPQSAAYFNGDVFLSASGDGLPQNTEARTIAFWHLRNSFDTRQFMGYGDASCGTQFIMNFNNFDLPALSDSSHIEIQGHCLGYRTFTQLPDDSTNWQHTAWVYDGSRLEIFVNGSLTDSIEPVTILNVLGSEPILYIGVQVSNSGNDPYLIDYPWNELLFHGSLDDFAIWDRALTPSEIEGLFLSTPIGSGCTDANACNYNSTATYNDGSCEYGCLYCGEGTVWDSTLQECVTDLTFPTAPCGEGTVWDPVNEECIIAIPADLNYDGCVSVNDLLLLLAVHGTCPPYPEWPDEPTDTTWTCGDPVTYWDYDYATVLIGDQCWFAENLRTASYLNGDDIPEPSNQDEWATLLLGMSTVYGSDEHTCYSAWNFDACDDSLALGEYGRLYNWWAVDDSRGLCPLEWHVASNQEWFELENHAAQNGFNGMEATALQSTSGWGVTGNGTDDFGFAAKPAGHCDFGGTFFYAGNRGKWWTSTYENGNGRYWYSTHMDPEIHSAVDTPKYGFSVRCIKD